MLLSPCSKRKTVATEKSPLSFNAAFEEADGNGDIAMADAATVGSPPPPATRIATKEVAQLRTEPSVCTSKESVQKHSTPHSHSDSRFEGDGVGYAVKEARARG
jgi:hypothetical protein